jgi:uncharacterized phage protein gp47/JayE
MADGLPTPKSREQILSEMLTEYVGLTGINDLNTGSVVTQFFDVVSRSVARSSGDIFQILRDFSVDRATGEALNRIGNEERVFRKTAQTARGIVSITDNSFEKISTKIYSGSAAPNKGATKIRVSDASQFPTSGSLYIGRGTVNIEGPLVYINTVDFGTYWEIELSDPTTRLHNVSESVILSQGGTRTISVGTQVVSPGAGATEDILYTTSSEAILLDGENTNNFVRITANQPGTSSNAPAGAIRQFSSLPFPNASVINLSPLTTGADNESDDDYRDRIKKERLSRGLGTALAIKNSVLGAKASDEDAVVTSNEIDTTNPEETILYIDNGEGYEEKTAGVGIEFIVDSAIGGEVNFQLSTGGQQTSVAKAFLISSNKIPFNVRSGDKLAVLVGGLISEHTFKDGEFLAPGAATAYEIVSSINDNPDITFQASTAESGTKILIQAKSEDNEFLQITSPTNGNDSASAFNFQSNEVSTILLYKNRELLNKNGRSASIVSEPRSQWSSEIIEPETLIISVDGTDEVTYSFTNEDFLKEGQHASISAQNSLSSWANVINSKVTGVTAEINGEQLKLTSNLGAINRASISVNATSSLVSKNVFSSDLGLYAEGNEADFQMSRNTAQIKLNKPLSEGDSLKIGSQFTRAAISSSKILGGQIDVLGTAYLWLIVDGGNIEKINTGVTSNSLLTVETPGGKIIRYVSNIPDAFSNVQEGDYVIVWSEELSLGNQLEGRVYQSGTDYIELKITQDEETAAVTEGPVVFEEGITVIRTEKTPQKIKVDAGPYNPLEELLSIVNPQLTNSEFKIENSDTIVISTNTEDISGSLYLADFNSFASPLAFTRGSSDTSTFSQLPFRESRFEDKQFPAFVHSKIANPTSPKADPPNSFVSSIQSEEDLTSLGIDPSGFVCLTQPYGDIQDVTSIECVEIQDYVGTTVNVEENPFYRRSRIDDRYFVLNGYDFGHEDTLVVILDNEPNGKTFNIPLYRTAITNSVTPANPDNFTADDFDGGEVSFTEFFDGFSFDNYKVLMQAKNVIDPGNYDGLGVSPTADKDAILYRAVEWGRSGEKIKIGYFYPTSPGQNLISHNIESKEDIELKIFLKSGIEKPSSIDGATEWNIIISPDTPSTERVTYNYSGTGPAPSLDDASLSAGDYVNISSTGEFNTANIGTYKLVSYTNISFTIIREINKAIAESNIATLQPNTITFYSPSDTTAEEIVEYVTNELSSFVTAEIVDDNGTTGAGIISESTEENSVYTQNFVYLLDGKNYILDTDLTGTPQFCFKNSLDLHVFITNSLAASTGYSFNNGEILKLIPISSIQVSEFFNVLAVTGITALGEVKSVKRNSTVQISSSTVGENGAVEIAGGTASSSVSSSIEGSASILGPQDSSKCIISLNAASSAGFHSDQWVKLQSQNKQKRNTFINNLNSIQITSSFPSFGFSKIELSGKQLDQRLFGNNRYHTRTRGRKFKVEKQGQFVCISWDGVGIDPFFHPFLKDNINIKD